MPRTRPIASWIACATVVVACAAPTRSVQRAAVPAVQPTIDARDAPPVESDSEGEPEREPDPPSCPDGFRASADGCVWSEASDEALAAERELYDEVMQQLDGDFGRARAAAAPITSFPRFSTHFSTVRNVLREADFELDFFVQSCRSPALVRGALERRSAMQREFARFIDQTTYSPPLPALPQPMHPQYARTQALRRQIIDSWEDFRHKERTQALREARRQEAVARGLAQRLLLVPAPADPNKHVAVGDAENLVAELERSLADKERPGCTRDAYAHWKPKGRLSPLMAVQLFQWYLQVGGL